MKITAITKLDSARKINTTKQNNVSFDGKKEEKTTKGFSSLRPNFTLSKHQKEFIRMQKDITPRSKEQLKMAIELARKYPIYKNEKTKTGLLTFEHFQVAFLTQLYNFTKDIQNDITSYETEAKYQTPQNYAIGITPEMWKKDKVAIPQKIILEELETATKNLQEKSKKGFVSSIEADEEIIDDFVSIFKFDAQMADLPSYKEIPFDDSTFFRSMILSSNSNHVKQTRDFYQKLAISMMIEKPEESGSALPFYENISKKVLKNLDRNFNTIVTYNATDKMAPKHFLKSLTSVLKDEKTTTELKNIDPKNTEVIIFNQNVHFANLIKELEKLAKNKDTHYIAIVENMSKGFQNSTQGQIDGMVAISDELMKSTFASKGKNIDMIFIDNQDNYYNLMSTPLFSNAVQDYQNIQIPIMDSETAKNQLLNTKEDVENIVGIKIENDAITSAVDFFTADENSKYDTAIKYLKKVASYFIEEEVLTKEHVESYWESTKKEDSSIKNGPYDIIFDTKMSLDDIVGSPMTKKQAELVAYEIKNYPQTKGYILYNTRGYGGGRFNVAKAIAGEAKIPMVSINAADFAIRDLDTINQNPMDAIEVKIKKLTDTLKTQAKANPNKTAMLFISNFDNFASNPLYGISSIYEQQAFSRLIKEMKKAQNDDSYNFIVMGSSDYPEALNENILRPGLFMDEIAIYPSTTRENVQDVAKRHLEKNKIKLAGQNDEENNKILKHFVNMMMGSSYIEIVDILNMANLLARKNEKDSISISEINEAYLIKTAGMPSEIEIDDRQKGLIIRHEGGHALNLQFMYNLFKEEGDSIRIPASISNIALDPRGDYLGCVYPKTSEENMTENNLETIFSDIVCSFGGNSSEELFYGMEGSWGISQDLINANQMAKIAVLRMGLGVNMDYFIPDIDPETGLPSLSNEDEENYTQDVKTFLYNAKYLSDEIVDCYSEFLNEFANKFLPSFGTGNCIITGYDFANMLKEWEEKQSPETKKEIQNLKETAKKIIKAQRDGEKYSKNVAKKA